MEGNLSSCCSSKKIVVALSLFLAGVFFLCLQGGKMEGLWLTNGAKVGLGAGDKFLVFFLLGGKERNPRFPARKLLNPMTAAERRRRGKTSHYEQPA